MIKKFHHYGVTVSNMTEALGFYQDTLGLKVEGQFSLDSEEFSTFVGVNGATAEIVFLNANTCFIELLEYSNPSGKNTNTGTASNDIGVSHFCLAVEDINSVFTEIARDYDYISTPQTLPNGTQVANIYDPDNNIVQLIQE